MTVRIRLARGGAKQRPYYRIVVADARSPRDGRFLEKVGTYNPLLEGENKIILNAERIQYWLSVGAQPSDRVARFLGDAGLAPKPVHAEQTKQDKPKQRAQERLAAAAAAAAAPAPEPVAVVEEPVVEEPAAVVVEEVVEAPVAVEAVVEEAPAAVEAAVVEEPAAAEEVVEEAPAADVVKE